MYTLSLFIYFTYSISIAVFMPNIFKFMHDPRQFPNPKKLIPERFIEKSSDGAGLAIKVSIFTGMYTLLNSISAK